MNLVFFYKNYIVRLCIIFLCLFLWSCGNKEQSRSNRSSEKNTEFEESVEKDPFDDELVKKRVKDLEEKNQKVSTEKTEIEKEKSEIEKEKIELIETVKRLKDVNLNKMIIVKDEFELKNCKAFLFLGQREEQLKNEKIHGIQGVQNYIDIKRYFNSIDQKDFFRDCNHALINIFISPIDLIFVSKYYENEDRYDTHLIKQARNYENIFRVLTGPENTFQLTQKVPSEMLCPLKVEKYTRLLTDIFPFEQLLDENNKLYSQESLLSKEFSTSGELYKKLAYARNLIEFTLTQQEILIGKGVLESFDLKRPYTGWREKVLSLLKENPILMTNLFLQDLRKSRKDLGLSENLEGEDFNIDNVEELNNRYPTWKFKNRDGVLRVYYQIYQNMEVGNEENDIEIHTVAFENGQLKVSGEISEDGFIHSDYLDKILKYKGDFEVLIKENRKSVERFLKESTK